MSGIYHSGIAYEDEGAVLPLAVPVPMWNPEGSAWRLPNQRCGPFLWLPVAFRHVAPWH